MTTENYEPQLDPAAMRATLRLQKQIADMHELRNTINAGLAKVNASNLSAALTQKKNLTALKKEYKKLEDELSPHLKKLKDLDNEDLSSIIAILETEFNYILTIENILETTRELKNNPNIPPEHRAGLIDGLTKFYDGLRMELALAAAGN